MTPFSSLKVAACLVVLAVFLCSRGEAQLCPNATMCDVNFTVIESFQQYNLDDNIKTCIRCLFNDTVFNDTTWNIEDPPISLTDEPYPLGTNNNGVLEICSTNPILDLTNDNGPRFICASATAGQSHTLFMTIRALNPPSITPVDEPLMVDEGTAELMLSCLHPDSQPVTLEQWTGPDGSVLSNQSTLILTNLARADTGLYTCTITDDRNETRNSSRTIVVRHAPIVTTQDGDTAVQLFDMLVRSCEIEAIPNATMITWLRDNTVLPNGADFQISSTAVGSMLIVSNISREGGGVYTCNATNALGSGQNGTTVSIIVPPEMPGNVRVLNVAKTSVNIEWTIGFDGGSTVTAADVEVFFASSNSLFRAVDDQDAIDEDLQAAFIDGLSPFTEYTIRVYLVNNRISGRSEPGEINVTTLSECLAAPLNLDFTFDCSVITVTWELPLFRVDTTPAANWTVEVEEVGGSMVSQENMTSDNGTTFMISTASLTIGSNYTVRVAGMNEGGTGNFSESIFQAADCPGAPQNVDVLACSAFAVTVSWEPPTTNGGSSVTGYTVSIGSASMSVTLMDPQQRSYFLSNLTGNTPYIVEVAAINSVGTGPTGSDQVTTLSEDLPQPILSAPMASSITQTSALITWVHPGGTVNTFFLQLTPVAGGGATVVIASPVTGGGATVVTASPVAGGGATVVIASTAAGTSIMLTVEGLLPEVMYTVSVVASNDNGNATSDCDTPAGNFTTLALDPTTMPTTAPTVAASTTITANGDELSDGLLTVEPGADVVLTCSSTSTGSPSWSRQSLDLPTQAVVDGGVLTLPMVTEQDSGVYICDSGGVSDTVALIVERGVGGRVIGIAVSISVVALLVVVALVVLLSVLLRKKCNAMPPAAEPSEPLCDYVNCSPEYEDPDNYRTQPYEMKENAAYGPVCQVQGLEMEENAAYGPLGH